VVFDLAEGASSVRPGPEDGYAACERASAGTPERGSVGAGAGAAVGKLFGRERATRAGVGCAATTLSTGETIAAIAIANAVGDVIGSNGELLGAPRDERGRLMASSELIAQMSERPTIAERAGGATTLICVCTDASLDKRGCGIAARVAGAGIARAVNPAFTQLDGDVVFFLASGTDPPAPPGLAATWTLTVLGTVAADVTAAAIRDAVRPDPRGH
jgi:L-aminopeptidase/D-esterase-like protein